MEYPLPNFARSAENMASDLLLNPPDYGHSCFAGILCLWRGSFGLGELRVAGWLGPKSAERKRPLLAHSPQIENWV